jgi:hypothetical protein
MRCYICDRVLKDPQYNQDHKSYDPCPSCLLVIEDLIAGYKDKPAAEEDDLPSDLDLQLLLYGMTGESSHLISE